MNTLFEKAFDMTGKLVLITGGGTGLGFAMACCFVAAGARVAITGRREDVLREACAELGENAYPISSARWKRSSGPSTCSSTTPAVTAKSRCST